MYYFTVVQEKNVSLNTFFWVFGPIQTRSTVAIAKLFGLLKLVNNIKTVTSRKLRSEFSQHLKKFYWAEKPQFWSGSYALISVGAQAPLNKLIEYVQNQENPE
jgi:REP element-mobilizing transposase RayT